MNFIGEKIQFFSFVIKVSILSLIIPSSNSLEVKRIEAINGSVSDLEFDYSGNIYGVVNVPVEFKFTKKIVFNMIDVYEWNSFLFKLNSDKQIAWKIEFRKGIISPLANKNIFQNTRILINRQNVVYLIVEEKNETEVYTPAPSINTTEMTLNMIFKHSPPLSISDAFIIGDNIISIGFSKDSPPLGKINVLKIKSGKLLTIAESAKDAFHFARDKEGNIYFTSAQDCHVKQELFILAHDSFKAETPTPQIIRGVINNNDNVTNLVFNNKNELYIGLHDKAASLVKVKKMTNNTLRTIFSRPGTYILVKPVDNGAVIRTIKETMYQDTSFYTLKKVVNDGGINKTITETHRHTASYFDIELMYVEEKNQVVPLSYYYLHQWGYYNSRQRVIKKAFRGNNAVSDKRGNLFFESEGVDPSDYEKLQLFFLNSTTREILNIPFPNEITKFFIDYEKIMIDKTENVWIWPQGRFSSDDQYLYCLEKGSLMLKEILDRVLVWKREGDDIFFGSATGLFVKSFDA